tara:strand:- start:220 stop:330 length:111 start_codon:yes stop_codon:yes gene_type:complete
VEVAEVAQELLAVQVVVEQVDIEHLLANQLQPQVIQ